MTKMQVLMLVHLLAEIRSQMMGEEMLCPGLIDSSMS